MSLISKIPMSEQDAPGVYRPDIDGLRALAILSVLLFHAFPNVLGGGFVGVDIFFVISGFLISRILFKSLQRGELHLVDFYAHRVKRIFPALITVLCVSYIFGWFELLPNEFKQLGKHIAAGVGFIQNFVLMEEAGYFDTASELKPLMHLWSLAIEEQFYLIYPLLIWLAWRIRLNILAVLGGLFLFSFMLNVAGVVSHTTTTFFSPHTRFWELLAGGVLAWLQMFRRAEIAVWLESNSIRFQTYIPKIFSWNSFLSVLGLILIVLALFGIRDGQLFPGWRALLPVGGAFLLILSGPNAWVNRHILASRILVWVGLISYPLYLWHWPIIAFLRITTSPEPSVVLRIVAVAASFLLAWVTYQFIEKPIRLGRKHWSKTVLLLLSLIAFGFIGFNTWQRNGFPDRPIGNGMAELSKITDVYEYFDYKRLMRVGVCHSVSFEVAHANGCVKNDSPSIFILGDSYAAALYSGISNSVKNQHKKYIINQLTDGNGPPFFEEEKRTDEGKTLRQANEERLQAISQTQPEIIIISWMVYGKNGIFDKKAAFSSLVETIDRLKSVSSKSRIIVIGPVPEWKGVLQKQLINFYRANEKIPPVYMNFGLNENIKPWDDFFKVNVPLIGVEYISAYDVFCRDGGCLTRTSDSPKDLIAVDWGHLSQTGSVYLLEKIDNLIFLRNTEGFR